MLVWRMKYEKWPSCWLILAYIGTNCAYADEKYNAIHRDGSFEFNYDTPDSFHVANGDRNNVVRGEFGGRNPKTGLIDKTTYTAGPRGYRPRGKNIARKYDLSQIGPRPIGSKDDPYFDPYEDPSYNFAFRTRTYSREENANRFGDVKGSYTYTDDVGERHNVEFVAGKRTGFHVKTPFPDSNPNAYGPLFFNGRGKPIPRGRTAIQRGLDGSYRFISAGPDQRRTETSDASGHVRGSYTYLDDKGVQHSVHYIAGPETGYRVLKNVKGPHLPTIYPFSRPEIIPPDYYDSFDKAEKELFDTAASGRPRPSSGGARPSGGVDFDGGEGDGEETGGSTGRPQFGSGNRRPAGRPKPPKPPTDDYDDGGEDIDLFGGGEGGSTARPTTQNGESDDGRYKPSVSGGGGSGGQEEEEEEGGRKPTYKPQKGQEDGSYKPSDDEGVYKPSVDDGAYRPSAEGRPSSRPRPKPPSGTFEGSTASGGSSSRPTADGGYADADIPTGGDESFGGVASPEGGGTGGYGGGNEGSTGRPSTSYGGEGGSTVTPGDFVRPSGAGGSNVGVGVSTYRPSRPIRPRPTRPPFSGGAGSRPKPSKPATDFNEEEEEEDGDFNLFGSDSSGPTTRPHISSSTTARPTAEGGGFLESGGTAGFEEDGNRKRPQKRPPFAQRPKPPTGFGATGASNKPNFGSTNTDDESVSGYNSPGREKPAVIGVTGGGDSSYERGTIVTNLGDKVFSVPPGVSVRAHVQAIDLLPLGSRIPSPSEQYRAETTVQSEQFKEASETVAVTTSKTTTTYNDEEDIF